MGFISPDLPDVDHDTWPKLPRAYAGYLLYLIKIGLYVSAPAAIISLTPGLGGLSHIGEWWTPSALLESGHVDVSDALTRQPWPEPGDEFPVHVTTEPVLRGTS